MHIEISLSLPRERESVSAVRRVVGSAMTEFGVEPSCVSDVVLALTEGCANAVRHARASERYHVTFVLDRQTARVTIADDGGGFPLNGVRRMAGALAEGGRGLALMEMLMDRTAFRVEDGGGTQVELTKHVELVDESLLGGDLMPESS